MPCRDYDDTPDRDEIELRAQNDRLTRLLCIACAELIDYTECISNRELGRWFDAHRKADMDNLIELVENANYEELSKEDFDVISMILEKVQ